MKRSRQPESLEHEALDGMMRLKPQLVAEVQYDHFSCGRFRHGTKFVRWYPERNHAACTFDQLK